MISGIKTKAEREAVVAEADKFRWYKIVVPCSLVTLGITCLGGSALFGGIGQQAVGNIIHGPLPKDFAY